MHKPDLSLLNQLSQAAVPGETSHRFFHVTRATTSCHWLQTYQASLRAQGGAQSCMCPVLKDQRPGQEQDRSYLWVLSQQLCLLQRKAKRAPREFYSLEFRGILMTDLFMIVLEGD